MDIFTEMNDILARFPYLDQKRFWERTSRAIERDPEHDPYDYAVRNALDEIRIGAEDWTYVAARLYLRKLYREAAENRGYAYDPERPYQNFPELVRTLHALGVYSDAILKAYSPEELELAGTWLDPKKDELFTYLGLLTMSTRYLARDKEGRTFELPQERYLVIALYLMQKEDPAKRMDLVREAYWALSNHYMTVATPTFANAGKAWGQLSSCFIDVVDDSLRGIYDSNTDAALLSKAGGGIGVYMGKLRPRGSAIKGIRGLSSGIVPWARQLNNTAVSVDQLGQRQGAIAIYLDVWHKDIFDFLDLKLNNGDPRMRTYDLFTGVAIPDLFMEQVEKRGPWYLFDPHEVRTKKGWSLEDFYDEEFGRGSFREKYWELVHDPEISKEEVPAIEVMKRIMRSQLETGSPYMLYRDTANRMNPNKHAGVIYASNLCVTGDTRLLTNKGYKTVKELYESQEPIKVVIDTRTVSLTSNEKGTKVVEAIPVQLTARDADVYKLTTVEGFEIKATDWHKMYVVRDGKIVKIPLSEVNIGDKILVMSGESELFGSFHDPDLAFVTGALAADGCLSSVSGGQDAILYLYGEKEQLREKLERAIWAIIDRYFEDKDTAKHNANFKPVFKRNGNRLVLSSNVLGKVLQKFGITKETKKKIPDFVWEGDKETISAYISAVFQLDGTVNVSEEYKSAAIEISQNDKEFLQGLQVLILMFGVYSTIYKTRDAGWHKLPDGNGGKAVYYTKEIYKLSIQDRASRDAFVKNFELKEKDERKLRLFESILQPKSRTPKHNYTATVKSIEYIGKEDVYDTMQKDYHSLIFNGIVTGNCSEILQNNSATTVVEEYLDEDGNIVTKKKPGDFVVCNLSSINLARAVPDDVLERLIPIQIRMLDNVIDLNRIEVLQAVVTNQKYRAVGLGVFGWHHLLVLEGIPWESEEAVEYADRLHEKIAFLAIRSSVELAKEKGSYPLFEGSEWQTGKYFERRGYVRPNYKELPPEEWTEWEKLADEVSRYGLRNGYLQAIAPTGTTSIVGGSTASIDPVYRKEYIEEKNNYRIRVIAPGMTPFRAALYKNAHEIDQMWSIRQNAARSKHVDQGISFNLYVRHDIKARDLLNLHLTAWKMGLKTTYYVRSTTVEVEECESCSS
ncbi:MAG: hypothetical protein KM296_00455 [Brockia lithotrophica]|nr:hypothetical protein [Brockia lithotrophica]